MIPIERAQRIIKEALPGLRVQSLELEEAGGRFLAEDVPTSDPLPHFDNSAMDGYAVATPPAAGGVPESELPVVGESRAGRPYPDVLAPGQAVAISTGAAVPEGADRVVPMEKTERTGTSIRLNDPGTEGDYIRVRGEEVEEGERIARHRERLTPPVVGRIAGCGIGQVSVYAPPRVALLTTGSELVNVGASRKPGQIPNANRYALVALLQEAGIVPVTVETVPDAWEATVQAIDRAAKIVDLVLVTGGVSVGPHDHVRQAARRVGFTKEFWKVRQKPGKPFYFATRGETLLFGLPGNPFSAFISTLVYVYPTVRRMCGDPHPQVPVMEGRLAQSFDRMKPGRARFLGVRIRDGSGEVPSIEVLARQGSHMLSAMSVGDGFILVPADRASITQGERFSARLFPWSGNCRGIAAAG